MLTLSVLLPSYRRHLDLLRCLNALEDQSFDPSEVIVVARKGDHETILACKAWRGRLPLKLIEVTEPGQVHALNVGLSNCVSDIICITDDDAAPHHDWVQRIQAHFVQNPKLGGVGGRDWLHHHGRIENGSASSVGKVQWFGRIIGNHHLGSGPARMVDIIKGANCAFRMQAIRHIGFDTKLRGKGAQVHNDMVASLAIKRAGWQLLYDPAIAVDHYPAPRSDGDRVLLSMNDIYDMSFNLSLGGIENLSWPKRYTVPLWSILIGDPRAPGLVRAFWLAFHGRIREASRVYANFRGTGEAIVTSIFTKRDK